MKVEYEVADRADVRDYKVISLKACCLQMRRNFGQWKSFYIEGTKYEYDNDPSIESALIVFILKEHDEDGECREDRIPIRCCPFCCEKIETTMVKYRKFIKETKKEMQEVKITTWKELK